jgi:glutamate dehydrogenase
VIGHNASQARVLSLDQRRSEVRLDDFRAHVAEIEQRFGVSRARPRAARGRESPGPTGDGAGLTRPELAVLLAWTKIDLVESLRGASLLDEPALESYLVSYFPPRLEAEYPDAIRRHRLRRDIIAVELANTLVDELGMTFAHRIARTSGASLVDVVRAWAIAWRLAAGARIATAVRSAHAGTDGRRGRRARPRGRRRPHDRWVLASPIRGVAEIVATLGAAVEPARARLAAWLTDVEAETLHRRRAGLEMAGLPTGAAAALAVVEWLPSLLDVATLARDEGIELETIGRRYYGLAAEIDFAWLDAQLAAAADPDPWARRAVTGAADELRRARRRLARGEASDRREGIAGIRRLVDELKTSERPTVAALVVIAGEIRRLSEGIA